MYTHPRLASIINFGEKKIESIKKKFRMQFSHMKMKQERQAKAIIGIVTNIKLTFLSKKIEMECVWGDDWMERE